MLLATKRRRVRNLHWKAIPKQKLNNTFWSELGNIDLNMEDDLGAEADEIGTEFIDMFSLSPNKGIPLETF